MSLDKAILHGIEHRKSYRGAKAFDSFCRNHGRCDYCKENRLYHTRKNEEKFRLEVRDYIKNLAS